MNLRTIFILINLIFYFSQYAFSQIQTEIVLFIDSTKTLKNPRQNKIDSLREKFNEGLKELYDSGYTVSTNEGDEAILFFLDAKGDTVSFKDHIANVIPSSIDEFKIYLEFIVDWQGNIKKVSSKKHKGNIDEIPFYEIFSKLDAIPDKEFGIPSDTKFILPIYKKN